MNKFLALLTHLTISLTLLTGCSFSSSSSSSEPASYLDEVITPFETELYSTTPVDNQWTYEEAATLESMTPHVTMAAIFDGSDVSTSISDTTKLSVSKNNGLFLITANDDAEIILSGSFQGSVMIVSPARVKVVLNQVSIAATQGAALNIQSKKRSYVVLQAGTTNTLSDSITYAQFGDYDMKATLFSEDKLIIDGEGTLLVSSQAHHAIAVDDGLIINNGQLEITGTGKDGIHVNDYVIVNNGTLTITSFQDGIQIENGAYIQNGGLVQIAAQDDGIISSIDTTKGDVTKLTDLIVVHPGDIYFFGGHLDITYAREAVEAFGQLFVYGGTVEVFGTDDGLNANKDITIASGYVYAHASQGDGIDSNAILHFNGGVTIATGGSSPEGGIDNDANGIEITGGLLIGLGGVTSYTTVDRVEQPVYVTGSGLFNQNYVISLGDNILVGFKAPQSYSTMMISFPELALDTTYQITRNGTLSGTAQFHGLYLDATLSNGASTSQVTLTSLVSQLGGSLGPEWVNGGFRP